MQITRTNSWMASLQGILEAPKTSLASCLRRVGRIIFIRSEAAHRERRMELVERLELGGRRQLVLVICDGNRYLVGAGPDTVYAITEMGGADKGRNSGQSRRCES